MAVSKGLTVVVCVGHSGNIGVTDSTYNPYGLPSDPTTMTAFLADPNVGYLSPQLYSSGSEDPPQYNVNGLPWSAWASSGKKIIAAIPWAQQYSGAETWAQTQGITLNGFIQWNNTVYSGGGGGGGGNFNITLTVQNNTPYLLTVVPANSGFTPNAGQSLALSTNGSSVTGTTTISSVQVNLNLNSPTLNYGDIQYSPTGVIYATGSNISDGTSVVVNINGTNYGPYENGSGGWTWTAFNGTISAGSTIIITFTHS